VVKQEIFYNKKRKGKPLESTIIFVLIFTFILSSIFKTAFWLKIPIGCFLLVLGSLAHGVYQTTGLVVFAIVFALPYVVNKNMFQRFLEARINKPLVKNYASFENNAFSIRESPVAEYTVSHNEIIIKPVNINFNSVEMFFVRVDLRWHNYLSRGLFIAPILFVGTALYVKSTGIHSINTIKDFFDVGQFLATIIFGFPLVVFTYIEIFFYITSKETQNIMERFKSRFSIDVENKAREKAEQEQIILIQKEEEKQRQIKQTVLKTEQQITRRREIEANIKIEKLRTERPEKERKLSAILDKLDDL
jgi:hypothetical protein